MIKRNLLGSSMLLMIIPLALSTYTHFLNPIGFPNPEHDENRYMQRVMNILEGKGPQDPRSSYDAPYFAQFFIAGILGAIGYPDSLNPSADGNVHSIEILWKVPRLLMGILAVIDTFLIYKISERHCNRYVALFSAILFAVMPITWLLRRIWLESVLLPFLLSSILFALYTNDSRKTSNENKKILLILFSGISLGLAIFTKIPAFTMIPLIGLLIYKNNKNLKMLGLWFIPVILIPLIWPAHAIFIGELDRWIYGINHQTHRTGSSFVGSIKQNLDIDPILLVIGASGLLYATLKRDFFLLLWVLPFAVFSFLIGWTQFFHFILILPAFCIGASKLIVDLSNKLRNRRAQQFLPFVTISGLAIFGLVTLTITITGNFTTSYFEAAAFIVQYLHDNDSSDIRNYNTSNDNVNSGTTVISNPFYLWIPQYVFDFDDEYIGFFSVGTIKTQKVILIVDEAFRRAMLYNNNAGDWLRKIYNSYDKSVIATIDDVTILSYDVLQPSSQIRPLNLMDQNHIWKPFNKAKISQNYSKLIINVNTNITDERYSRASLPIHINSTIKKPLFLTLAYSTESLKGKATFLAEIKDDKLKKLWNQKLNNTLGRLAIDTFILPDEVDDRQLELRISVITQGAGEHTLTFKNIKII